jgi:hypothetical protein
MVLMLKIPENVLAPLDLPLSMEDATVVKLPLFLLMILELLLLASVVMTQLNISRTN